MLKEDLEKIIGADRVLDSKEELEAYGRDWLKDYRPNPSIILLPNTYQEVQAILSYCNENNLKVVPSGGRTGLSGGATATNSEIVIAFDKLNKIVALNSIDQTITLQAGVTTQRVQEAAAQAGLYFPVDFASKGSSQIGGNVATNAGGIRVIRYGNIRDWVLGLKVITADGKLLELNKGLYKNQTGYDLRSLFIGSEGTLGVIVEVTLRLIAPAGDLIRVICGLDSVEKILELLPLTRKRFSSVSAFEYFSRFCLEKVIHHHGLKDPLQEKCNAYALIEIEDDESTLRSIIEEFFFTQIEDGLVKDAAISQGSAQADAFMKYRELIPETMNSNYTPHKNDLALPVSNLPVFIKRLDNTISSAYPDFEVAIFGHVGDGNLHVNVLKPAAMSNDDFFTHCKSADKLTYALVQECGGSISAEHGVGLLKKDFLTYTRSVEEISLMKEIKAVFDPKSTLNPGKIFD